VQRVGDGNDLNAIEAAIEMRRPKRRGRRSSPVRTVIGYGSPKAGTNKVHGEALGRQILRRRRSFSASLRIRVFM